jgi:hypothetical protein
MYCTGGDTDNNEGRDKDEIEETDIASLPPTSSNWSHSSWVQSPNVILSRTLLYRRRRFSQSVAAARSVAAAALASCRSSLLPLDASFETQKYPLLRS